MLSSNMLESSSGRIDLPGISRSALRTFLRMIYTGCVDPADWDDPGSSRMPLAVLGEVASLSKKYLVTGIFKETVEVLKERAGEACKGSDIQAIEEVIAIACSLE